MIEPKKPTKGTWQRFETNLGFFPQGTEIWTNPFGVVVASSLAVTKERELEWHMSVSEAGDRPSRGSIAWVRECFGAEDFEEDNHGTRVTVNLWKPTVKDLEGRCDCKSELWE